MQVYDKKEVFRINRSCSADDQWRALYTIVRDPSLLCGTENRTRLGFLEFWLRTLSIRIPKSSMASYYEDYLPLATNVDWRAASTDTCGHHASWGANLNHLAGVVIENFLRDMALVIERKFPQTQQGPPANPQSGENPEGLVVS